MEKVDTLINARWVIPVEPSCDALDRHISHQRALATPVPRVELDAQGRRHMEYVAERGSFDDVPLERILTDFAALYPAWRDEIEAIRSGDFLADVARERLAVCD